MKLATVSGSGFVHYIGTSERLTKCGQSVKLVLSGSDLELCNECLKVIIAVREIRQ